MANYCWLLMEGLYIHNLIIFALFSDNTSILVYVILGWGLLALIISVVHFFHIQFRANLISFRFFSGLPMIFVALWVFFKIKLENEYCWTTRTDSKNFLIIRIPIIISILVCLFTLCISCKLYICCIIMCNYV